jgi:hypothetical protein
MRILLAALCCAAVASCGQVSQGEAQASVPEVLTGQYRAASDTARAITGNVSLERGGLIFDRGVVLYTRALLPRTAHERVARDGDSYAAILVSSGDQAIDLRRVTEQTLTGNAESLCGDDEPGYVAIAGDEAPGPQATQSRLCAAFRYAAPDGARTREGVVLR